MAAGIGWQGTRCKVQYLTLRGFWVKIVGVEKRYVLIVMSARVGIRTSRIWHAKSTCLIILSIWLHNFFFTSSLKQQELWGKKIIEHKTYVLMVSTKSVWNISTKFVWNISTKFVWNISTKFVWNISTKFVWNISTKFVWNISKKFVWNISTKFVWNISTKSVWNISHTKEEFGVYHKYTGWATKK